MASDFVKRFTQFQRATLEFLVSQPEKLSILKHTTDESEAKVRDLIEFAGKEKKPMSHLAKKQKDCLARSKENFIFVSALALQGLETCISHMSEIQGKWIPELIDEQRRILHSNDTVALAQLVELIQGAQAAIDSLDSTSAEFRNIADRVQSLLSEYGDIFDSAKDNNENPPEASLSFSEESDELKTLMTSLTIILAHIEETDSLVAKEKERSERLKKERIALEKERLILQKKNDTVVSEIRRCVSEAVNCIDAYEKEVQDLRLQQKSLVVRIDCEKSGLDLAVKTSASLHDESIELRERISQLKRACETIIQTL